MRALKLLVVLLLGVVLLLPNWVGQEAEKAFRSQAAALSQSNDWELDVQVVSYERGWYRSTAQTRLTVRGAPPAEAVVLDHEIVHGPVPVGDVMHGRLPFDLVGAVVYSHDAPSSPDASGAHSPFVTLRTQVGFQEDLTVDYELHPSRGATEGLEWDGLHGTASVPKTGTRTMTVESSGFRAAQGGFSLDIGKLAGTLEMDPSASGIPVGRSTVEVAHVVVERTRSGGARARPLDIRDVTWTHEVAERVAGKTIDLSSGVSFGAVRGPVRGTVRGWGSRIQSGEWHLVCQGLDYQALRSLERAGRAAAGRQARLAALDSQALAPLLSRPPSLETRFTLTTTDGVIEGTGDMALTSTLAALRADARPTHLPTEWLLTIYFTPAVLDPAKLDPIWRANVLTVDGERYRLTARYRRGLVDLNGTIHSLGDFGARLLLLLSALRL